MHLVGVVEHQGGGHRLHVPPALDRGLLAGGWGHGHVVGGCGRQAGGGAAAPVPCPAPVLRVQRGGEG